MTVLNQPTEESKHPLQQSVDEDEEQEDQKLPDVDIMDLQEAESEEEEKVDSGKVVELEEQLD